MTANPGGRLPAPTPPSDADSQPMWDAAREGYLLLRRCCGCGEAIWFPRPICPLCSSDDTEWFRASGEGTVYSCTLNTKGLGEYAGADPYVLAYVELDEGPRVLTNLIGEGAEGASIGDRVTVAFTPTDDASTALPRFSPRTDR